MGDYRLKVSIRNARFLRAIESLGHNPSSFANAHGFTPTEVCGIAAMKTRPLRKNGDYRDSVVKLCELTGKMPCDLFTPRQLEGMDRNTSETEISEAALDAYRQNLEVECRDPLAIVMDRDLAKHLNEILDSMSPRYAAALRAHCDGATLREIGKEMDIGPERVRQIIMRAMRRAREKARRHGGFIELLGPSPNRLKSPTD